MVIASSSSTSNVSTSAKNNRKLASKWSCHLCMAHHYCSHLWDLMYGRVLCTSQGEVAVSTSNLLAVVVSDDLVCSATSEVSGRLGMSGVSVVAFTRARCEGAGSCCNNGWSGPSYSYSYLSSTVSVLPFSVSSLSLFSITKGMWSGFTN